MIFKVFSTGRKWLTFSGWEELKISGVSLQLRETLSERPLVSRDIEVTSPEPESSPPPRDIANIEWADWQNESTS